MEKSSLKMKISASKPGAHMRVLLDHITIWQGDPGKNPVDFVHEFEDADDVNHQLILEMDSKRITDTVVDEGGNIVDDLVFYIKDISFDDIAVDQLVHEMARYRHDFNGSGDHIEEGFYGVMGCNGQVKFDFKTPIYLWLLENM